MKFYLNFNTNFFYTNILFFGLKLIVSFLINNEPIPHHLREKIAQSLQTQIPIDTKNMINMTLFCPLPESMNLPKWKFALVFPNQAAVASFIEEVSQSEDKQTRLSIEDYSVFGNVMFAFMRRQFKLFLWVECLRDSILNQPIAVLIFNQRFKQLVDLVEKGTHLNYQIEWDYQLQPRKYKKRNVDEEETGSNNPKQNRSKNQSKIQQSPVAIDKISNQKKLRINQKIEPNSRSPSTGDRISCSPVYDQTKEPTIPMTKFDFKEIQIKNNYSSQELNEILQMVSVKVQYKITEINQFFKDFQHFLQKLQAIKPNN